MWGVLGAVLRTTPNKQRHYYTGNSVVLKVCSGQYTVPYMEKYELCGKIILRIAEQLRRSSAFIELSAVLEENYLVQTLHNSTL
jgi:hypothetical protein